MQEHAADCGWAGRAGRAARRIALWPGLQLRLPTYLVVLEAGQVLSHPSFRQLHLLLGIATTKQVCNPCASRVV